MNQYMSISGQIHTCIHMYLFLYGHTHTHMYIYVYVGIRKVEGLGLHPLRTILKLKGSRLCFRQCLQWGE